MLLVSIDRAHSLTAALGVTVEPGSIGVVTDGIDVVEIDTLALLEERFREVAATLRMGESHNHGVAFGALEPGELTGLPGVQELLGLAEIVDLADDGGWDLVVVDCPAGADAVATLAAPDSLLGYLERVWPQHERVTAGTGLDLRMTVLVAATERIAKSVTAVRDLLADRARTSVRLITVAERLALVESARVRSAVALLGLRLDAIVVNKVLPSLDPPGVPRSDDDHPAARWYRNRRIEQLEMIAQLEHTVGDVLVTTAQHAGPEPVGLAALGALAYAVDSDPGHAEGAGATESIAVTLESGTGLESVYAMRMYLPVAQPSSLRLGRVEDDLIVGADGNRRRVPLAPVLRRCAVAGAELDADCLIVRFRPDATQWPAT